MIATLLWADLTNPYVWIVLLVTVSFGLLGFVDDYMKVTKRSSDGVSGTGKLLVQFLVAILASYLVMRLEEPALSGTRRGAVLQDACSSRSAGAFSSSASWSSSAPPMR